MRGKRLVFQIDFQTIVQCILPRRMMNRSHRTGHHRLVAIVPEGHDALLLGPVAVHPTHQGEGLGSLLIRDVLERAEPAGWPRILLVGDAPYYERFGFKRLNGVVMPPPTNPDRVLGFGPWAGIRGRVRKRLDALI